MPPCRSTGQATPGRLLHNPWVARRLLDSFPSLQVSADLSHWVCVAERLDIGRAVIELVAERTVHIDARVGCEQAPQVADPAAARHAVHRTRFEGWWDQIWSVQQAQGRSALSITPEYGPPPYQPVDPIAGVPGRALDDIVTAEAAYLRARYGAPTAVVGHSGIGAGGSVGAAGGSGSRSRPLP